MPERNPYLILGVDYGSSGDQARRAFAHAAKRLRRKGGIWEVSDLNWALHEIEALETNPADMVSFYRVPGDASAYTPPGGGLLNPPAVPLARRTPERDEETIAEVRRRALREIDDSILASVHAGQQMPANGYELEVTS